MASTYQAYNLPYNQPSTAQEYWSNNSNGHYPPPANGPKPPTTMSGPHLTANVQLDPNSSRAGLSRTPSPTPSEQKELQTGAIDFKALMNWRFWFRKEWFWYYVIGIILVTLTTLMTIYHTQIVHWLTPTTQWLQRLKFGWLVPIGILFVISFPPLFGHEIVAVLCGVVWGLWPGFGIVAAGTFLGEVGNFYAFKYCCSARGEKMEKSKISYACLARVVREGGFKVALIARLSAIPGHFTTAVFSTCGMNIFVFSIAAILSLPKQFVTVYLGVILEQSGSGQESTKQKLISDAVVGITILITVAACWWILRKMNQAKPAVIYDRRKARQAKLAGAGVYGSSPHGSDVFDPAGSETNIPLTASKKNQFDYGIGPSQAYPFSSEYQSSQNGNIVYAPKAQHPDNRYSQDDLSSEESLGHVAPGASSSPYNYTPTRQSSEDVTFESHPASQSHSHPSSPYLPPGVPVPPQSSRTYTQSPDFIPPQPQSSDHPYQSSPSYPATSSSGPYTTPSYQPAVAQTPTQPQFVSYNPNPASPGLGSSLPTPTAGHYGSAAVTSAIPGPQSPATPTQSLSQHAYEPTFASYHTAMSSSDSAGFPEHGGYDQNSHPPPPSYESH